MVCEGTGENVFVIRDGVIATPGQTSSILDGINRKSVIEIARDLGYQVVERDVARAELALADEVFLTGTAAELTPLREIDDIEIGPPGEITRQIQRVFDDALHGRAALPRVARPRARTVEGVTGARRPAMSKQVQVYDTTLRDGMQGEGMSLSADEKLRVAHALDGLGVHLIEAGFLGSNPKDTEVFQLLERETFEHAELAAFGMTRRRGLEAAEDRPAGLADSAAPVCTLVGKTWRLHLDKVTKVDPEENLAMIADSVAFLRSEGKRVVYDAEHFFDAFREDREYALRCLRAAVEAGAETVALCDTNGATLPGGIAHATLAVVAEQGDHATIGIHTHDDAGCGVANTLVAVDAGARQCRERSTATASAAATPT